MEWLAGMCLRINFLGKEILMNSCVTLVVKFSVAILSQFYAQLNRENISLVIFKFSNSSTENYSSIIDTISKRSQPNLNTNTTNISQRQKHSQKQEHSNLTRVSPFLFTQNYLRKYYMLFRYFSLFFLQIIECRE